MIAVATIAGTAAYALFLLGGESRLFAACMAVVVMCAAIVTGA